MKKLLIALMLLFVFGGAHAVSSGNTLIINRADGVKEYIALTKKMTVKAAADTLVLERSGLCVAIALADVDNFTFGSHTFADGSVYEGDHRAESAIDRPEAPERELLFGDGFISARPEVVVYDLRGVAVARGRRIDTSALPSGIYIVKCGTTSLKIKL